mmetsp:Transcript_18363/g.52391  ORF Transcript_18363/g.52391 Transcript_18363/m.52391 type:complete len:208 (-) Transcript_18363:261-884(-)
MTITASADPLPPSSRPAAALVEAVRARIGAHVLTNSRSVYGHLAVSIGGHKGQCLSSSLVSLRGAEKLSYGRRANVNARTVWRPKRPRRDHGEKAMTMGTTTWKRSMRKAPQATCVLRRASTPSPVRAADTVMTNERRVMAAMMKYSHLSPRLAGPSRVNNTYTMRYRLMRLAVTKRTFLGHRSNVSLGLACATYWSRGTSRLQVRR